MLNIPMTLFMMLCPLAQASEPQPTHHVVIDIRPVNKTTADGALEYEVKLVVHPPYKIQNVKENTNDITSELHTEIFITKEEE